MQAITGTARRHLRSLGHHLSPVVQVGKEGVTPALIGATSSALTTHELIKVKISDNTEGDRHELAAQLAKATSSEIAAVIGRTVLLYKRNPKKPKIVLPVEGKKKPAPATKKSAAAAAPTAADSDADFDDDGDDDEDSDGEDFDEVEDG